MRVQVVSHLYPSVLSHTWGSFVHNQTRFVAQHVAVGVVSPVPWFPPLPGCGRWSALRRIPPREQRDGIEVLRPRFVSIPRRRLRGVTWRSYSRALALAMASAPALIHAHCAFPDAAAALPWGRRLGIPVVVTVHGHDVKVLPGLDAGWRRFIADALQAAQAVIAVSAELAERVAALGVPAERIERIPNGVDCELFAQPLQRSPGEGGWHLVYVGRFDRAKGVEDLLQALATVRRRRRDVRLDLVGGNPLLPGGGAEVFRQLARQLGLADCVTFHDEVPWSQIPAFLAAADVFVLPSHSEGLPLALLESQAAGLPAVVTRCGGPVEVVDAENGRLVEVGDRDALAAAIDAVLDGYGDYDREAIRRRAATRYDYRGVARRICDLYERLVDRAPADDRTAAAAG